MLGHASEFLQRSSIEFSVRADEYMSAYEFIITRMLVDVYHNLTLHCSYSSTSLIRTPQNSHSNSIEYLRIGEGVLITL